MSVGGAEVSDKHGNFIGNRGGSTSKDVQSLIANPKTSERRAGNRFGARGFIPWR